MESDILMWAGPSWVRQLLKAIDRKAFKLIVQFNRDCLGLACLILPVIFVQETDATDEIWVACREQCSY